MPTSDRQPRDGTIVCGEKLAREAEKHRALSRQAHHARRAFYEPLADARLQPLELHADRTLRRAERIRCARETAQVRNPHECLNGIDVERCHVIYPVSVFL